MPCVRLERSPAGSVSRKRRGVACRDNYGRSPCPVVNTYLSYQLIMKDIDRSLDRVENRLAAQAVFE